MTYCGAPDTNEQQPSCEYNPHTAHRTSNASTYHHQKCMKRVVESMQDKEKCVGYFTAIAYQNPDMQACSISDLEDICDKYTPHFSVQDAERLCSNINRAQTTFWRDMYTHK